MNKFWVIDEEGGPSWNAKTEKAETFRSYETAKRRALELAGYEPGKDFFICKPVAVAHADVSAASVVKL